MSEKPTISAFHALQITVHWLLENLLIGLEKHPKNFLVHLFLQLLPQHFYYFIPK
jgi:hypothetical protein